MSSDMSDKEMPTAVPEKEVLKQTAKTVTTKELPEKQEPKKLSTKEMILAALSNTKSSKGISLYAVKKYMQNNFSVDIERNNHLIRKNLKESVEAGTIIQTKGNGASGSFGLAPASNQPKKRLKEPKKPNEAAEKEEKVDKPKKSSSINAEKDGKTKKTGATNGPTGKRAKEDLKESKKSKISTTKENPQAGTSSMKTPKKKANIMKRKSIDSIIKAPKMKPARAK